MSDFAEFQKARNYFLGYVLSSAAILVGILLLPKDPAPAALMRLAMTAVFFVYAMLLVWSFTQPLDAYLEKSFAWQYDGAGPAIQHTLSLIRANLMATIRPLAWLIMAILGFIALDVLSRWPMFGPLAQFRQLCSLGWTLALIALPLFLFSRGRQLMQVAALRQQLGEQLATTGARRRTDADAQRDQALAAEPAVRSLGEGRFRAGGFDWSWDDFYKNGVIFGQTGSGKTVCVLNALIEGLIASTAESALKPSGLILDPKGDFRGKAERLFRKYGRMNDILILDPHSPTTIRWNPLDTADAELEVAARFKAVFEILGQTGKDDGFFVEASRLFIQNALILLRLQPGENEPPSLTRIFELSTNTKMLVALVEAAQKRSDLGEDDQVRFRAAGAYFDENWMSMAAETRSGVQGFLSNTLSPFLMPPYHRVFAGRSTVSMADIVDSGKVLYVYMPLAENGMMSRIVNTLVKLEFYRQVLTRPDKPRPSFFLCDEFQAFFTAGEETSDANFFERSRQSNHANIVATQNRPALLKHAPTPHPVDNMLGHCTVKMFLRNAESETNEWASKLFGERLEILPGTSRQVGGLDPRRSGAGQGISGSTQFVRSVRPEDFTMLAQPSRPDAIDYAETIIHLGSRAKITREKLRWRVHPI
jgi:type IV secretory pathway TraG/TraD family ATPase VirD4